uniref:Uncharacterized protein n=1 Tax=Arundo donax TaxID=35708 RepID=A0A0A9EQZ9_ARUDO
MDHYYSSNNVSNELFDSNIISSMYVPWPPCSLQAHPWYKDDELSHLSDEPTIHCPMPWFLKSNTPIAIYAVRYTTSSALRVCCYLARRE